jgi:hypothetical protein
MKKLTIILSAFLFSMSSCVLSHTAVVTSNPVGTKEGVARTKLFDRVPDFTFKTAKENGGIERVGIAEIKHQQFVIFPVISTRVTGE